jgi:hypothetical protein
VFVPISSTNTRERASSVPATVTLQAALRHSSRSSAPTVVFSRVAPPLEEPPQGHVAKALASELLQEAAPFSNGDRESCAYVLLEEFARGLVRYGGSAASFPGG